MTKTWPQNQTSNLALIGISFFRARDALYNNFTRVFDALKNFPIIKYSTNILSSCSSAIFFSRNEPTITRRVSGFGVNSVYTEPILPSIFYSPVIKLIRIFEPRITYRYANSTVKLESFMICSITSSKHVFEQSNYFIREWIFNPTAATTCFSFRKFTTRNKACGSTLTKTFPNNSPFGVSFISRANRSEFSKFVSRKVSYLSQIKLRALCGVDNIQRTLDSYQRCIVLGRK